MRWGGVACLHGLLGVLAWVAVAEGKSCYFSDLSWVEPGRILRFQAGQADDPFTLRFDLTTGAVVCLSPRVTEPVWDATNRRVLWRDPFGIYECQVENPRSSPRPLVFLPEASNQFLRAVGSDAQGALLLWTLDQHTGEHGLWVRRNNGLEQLPGGRDGSEVLGQWEQRNVARRFQSVGGQFVRSLCVQQEDRRICLEQYGQARRIGAPLFRLVLGGPKSLDILIDRCVPTAVAISADSSRVVFGLMEEVDADGGSEVLSGWVSDFEGATRLYETLLPSRVGSNRRHRGWAHWLSRRELLWADAAGQLVRISTNPPSATILVASQAERRRALSRVVALTSAERDAAERARAQLETAGFEVGLLEGPKGFEVQCGVFVERQAAEDRSGALQRRGFPEAHVEQGGVENVAPGLAVSVLQGPGGATLVVRHRRQGQDFLGEIWLREEGGTERLLLPSFETTPPTMVDAGG